MLPMKAVKKFIRREEEQGTKLEEAHRRRYNRSLRQTQMLPNKDGKLELVQVIYPSHFVREMRRLGLRAAQAPRLAPHNSCARIWWFRTLGGHVCEHLGATGPSWATKDRVWFVTLVDKRMAFDPDAWVEVAHDYNLQPQAKPEPIELRRNYLPLLEDLNYVAMIEPTLYVSTRRVHGRKTTILYHVHALVWGIEEPELKKHCEMVRDQIEALLPYATSADYRQVNEGDLLQMLWYVSKAPRKQYQLHRRPETGTLKQFKRDINGVNSVLLHGEMAHMTLDQLTLAGGEGEKLLKRTMRDAKRWRESSRRIMRLLARWRRRRRLRRLRSTTPSTRAAKEQNQGRKGEKRA